jgi:opacity protein-like surface antigen
MRIACLVGVLVLGFSLPAIAQRAPAFELSGGYSLLRDEEQDFHGWVASGAMHLSRGIGVVGEVGGNYATLRAFTTDIDFSVHSFLGGARVSVPLGRRVTSFGQCLVGVVRLGASAFDETYAETRLAVQPGAGVDIWVRPNVGVRVGGDYRRVRRDEGWVIEEVRLHIGVVVMRGRR